MMTILTKEAILGAADLKTEAVEVPEWGGTVRISVMSGLARDQFLAQQNEKAAFSEFQSRLLVSTIVDDANQPIFTADDIDALRGKNQAVLSRLSEVAMRLNGMEPKAVENAAKNSEAAPSGDSGSNSALTSASQ